MKSTMVAYLSDLGIDWSLILAYAVIGFLIGRTLRGLLK